MRLPESERGETYREARRLIASIARGLARCGGEGTAEVLARLSEQRLEEADFREPEPHRLPALRHFDECVGEAMTGEPALAAGLAAIAERLSWRQSAGYNDALLGVGFMDNYGWCEIVGPAGFFAGDDFRLGLLLLGQKRHYTDHYHPAPELYWPLTGQSEWKRDGGAFESHVPFETIWHPALAVHATKTGERPLLAVWCWTRDTSVPARLVDP